MTGSPSDEALLAGLAAGQTSAAAAFVRRYQARVYGLVITIVRDPGIADRLVKNAQSLYYLSLNKLYIDEIYYAFIVAPLSALAVIFRIFDLYILDGLVDLIGVVPRFVGYLFRPIQNGLVQFYALLMVLGVAGFLLSVLLR